MPFSDPQRLQGTRGGGKASTRGLLGLPKELRGRGHLLPSPLCQPGPSAHSNPRRSRSSSLSLSPATVNLQLHCNCALWEFPHSRGWGTGSGPQETCRGGWETLACLALCSSWNWVDGLCCQRVPGRITAMAQPVWAQPVWAQPGDVEATRSQLNKVAPQLCPHQGFYPLSLPLPYLPCPSPCLPLQTSKWPLKPLQDLGSLLLTLYPSPRNFTRVPPMSPGLCLLGGG